MILRRLLFRVIGSSVLVLFLAAIADAQKVLPDAINDLAGQIAKSVSKQQKTRIAVVPFRELGGEPTVFGTFAAEELVTDLVNLGGLDLVERTTLDKVMGELKLNESGAIDPASAKQVGKLVGADAIVTGTITDLQSYVGVNCRLIDTQTGHIFGAAEARIVKDDDVKKILGTPMTSGGVARTGSDSQLQTSAQPQTPVSRPPLGPIQVKRQGVSVQEGDFLIAVQGCRRSGARLSCVGSVTNQAQKREQFTIALYNSFILDNLANQYTNLNNFLFGATCCGQELEPSIPVKFSFAVDNFDQQATQVHLVLQHASNGGQWQKTTLRDIQLQQQ